MGIQGLLPALKSIITPVHVRSYAGKKAAVDTYSWLHKAAFSCSKEICEGHPTDKFVEYCMHRVNLLRHYGVQPVMVFDGGVLPMKADEEAKRARSRKENLERAREQVRLGNHSGAFESYQRAVDITPALALRLIKVLKREGVQYVVAPYEADAQMAYLANHGLVDVIITEDSDLIAHGCPRVLFKMDKSGHGEEFRFGDIVQNKDLNFRNFTKEMVLEMCVMTGCDYLPSLPGMGIKRAHGLMCRFKSYRKVVRHLRFSGTTIYAQYEEFFQRALLTFRHQRVYDPVGQQMVHLTDVPDDVTVDLEFVGPDLPQELVKGIAEGEVDPSTNLPFEEVFTAVKSATPKFGNKIFSQQFVARKPVEMVPQTNKLTNYFSSKPVKAKKPFKAPRTVLGTKKQTENRSAKDMLGFLMPETVDLASFADEIFGTPLPDDDDEDSTSGATEAHNSVPGLEPQEGIRRRTGVLQDPRTLEGFSFSSLSSESPTTADMFAGKERKTSIVDAPPLKLSGYFSHPQSMRSQSSEPRSADCPNSIIDAQFEEVENCGRAVTKKSRIGTGEVAFEKVVASPSGREFEPEFHFDDEGYGRKRSAECRSTSFENRTQSSFSPTSLSREGASSEMGKFSTNASHIEQFSDIAQKSGASSEMGKFSTNASHIEQFSDIAQKSGASSEMGKFSTNVSHIEQFADIAQKSVDKFAATIENFRWSARGARASGLRAPLTTIPTNTSTRIAHSTVGSTLKKYAYQPSSFKPPSRTLNYTRPSAAKTGAVRAQENNCLTDVAMEALLR